MDQKHVSAVALLVLLTGCLGMLSGEPLEATADPVYVSEGALAETGYEHDVTENTTLNESVPIGENETREVHIENYQSTYAATDRPIGEDAMFIAFTSPTVGIAGYSVNPVGQADNAEVVELLIDQQADVGSLEVVDERTVTAFGEETTVTEYEGTTTMNGEELDLTIHMTQVKHNGDHVAAVGISPQGVDETENVLTLIEGLERESE